LTACDFDECCVSVVIPGFDERRHLGEYATRPIRPPSGALAALLLLAGMSLLRRRALPAHPMTDLLGRVQLRLSG